MIGQKIKAAARERRKREAAAAAEAARGGADDGAPVRGGARGALQRGASQRRARSPSPAAAHTDRGAATSWADVDPDAWWSEDSEAVAIALASERDKAIGADPLGLVVDGVVHERASKLPAEEGFDAEKFIAEVHSAATFADLRRGCADLKKKLGTRDRKLQVLVRENLDAFLRSADEIGSFTVTFDRLLESERGRRKTIAQELRDLADEAERRAQARYAPLLACLEQARDVEAAKATLHAFAPLLDAASRMARAAAMCKWGDAVKHYERCRDVEAEICKRSPKSDLAALALKARETADAGADDVVTALLVFLGQPRSDLATAAAACQRLLELRPQARGRRALDVNDHRDALAYCVHEQLRLLSAETTPRLGSLVEKDFETWRVSGLRAVAAALKARVPTLVSLAATDGERHRELEAALGAVVHRCAMLARGSANQEEADDLLGLVSASNAPRKASGDSPGPPSYSSGGRKRNFGTAVPETVRTGLFAQRLRGASNVGAALESLKSIDETFKEAGIDPATVHLRELADAVDEAYVADVFSGLRSLQEAHFATADADDGWAARIDAALDDVATSCVTPARTARFLEAGLRAFGAAMRLGLKRRARDDAFGALRAVHSEVQRTAPLVRRLETLTTAPQGNKPAPLVANWTAAFEVAELTELDACEHFALQVAVEDLGAAARRAAHELYADQDIVPLLQSLVHARARALEALGEDRARLCDELIMLCARDAVDAFLSVAKDEAALLPGTVDAKAARDALQRAALVSLLLLGLQKLLDRPQVIGLEREFVRWAKAAGAKVGDLAPPTEAMFAATRLWWAALELFEDRDGAA